MEFGVFVDQPAFEDARNEGLSVYFQFALFDDGAMAYASNGVLCSWNADVTFGTDPIACPSTLTSSICFYQACTIAIPPPLTYPASTYDVTILACLSDNPSACSLASPSSSFFATMTYPFTINGQGEWVSDWGTVSPMAAAASLLAPTSDSSTSTISASSSDPVSLPALRQIITSVIVVGQHTASPSSVRPTPSSVSTLVDATNGGPPAPPPRGGHAPSPLMYGIAAAVAAAVGAAAGVCFFCCLGRTRRRLGENEKVDRARNLSPEYPTEAVQAYSRAGGAPTATGLGAGRWRDGGSEKGWDGHYVRGPEAAHRSEIFGRRDDVKARWWDHKSESGYRVEGQRSWETDHELDEQPDREKGYRLDGQLDRNVVDDDGSAQSDGEVQASHRSSRRRTARAHHSHPDRPLQTRESVAHMEKLYDQDYKRLFVHHARTRTKFVDETFPPNDSSLYLMDQSPMRPNATFRCTNLPRPAKAAAASDVVWIRASELVAEPHLFSNEALSANIVKGALGDCWIASAVSALTIHPSLVERVVPSPSEQDWINDLEGRRRGLYYRGYHRSPDLHPGIFRFRFNRFGEWVEVVVDDYLPCTPDGELVYARSRDPSEFWVSLLEKAFAKLKGSYGSLELGSPTSAFVDLSGNVPEIINLRDQAVVEEFTDHSLFRLMKRAMGRGALMSCSMQPAGVQGVGMENDQGLVYGHSYAITDVVKVKVRMSNLRKRNVELIKLRNPWGGGGNGVAFTEDGGTIGATPRGYTGAWSDWSDEWQLVTQQEMKRLRLTYEDDGAFFMSFEDFLKHFTSLIICHQFSSPDRPNPGAILKPNVSWQFTSCWSLSARTAGGCVNNALTFPDNPQYLIHLPAATPLMISLMQKDRCHVKRDPNAAPAASPSTPRGSLTGNRSLTSQPSISTLLSSTSSANGSAASSSATLAPPASPTSSHYENLSIGYAVVRVEENRRYRVHRSSYEVVHMITYVNSREVTGRVRLGAGRYVLIPTTFEPGVEGEFVLRVHCAAERCSGVRVEPLTKDFPRMRRFGRAEYPIGVLRCEVVAATGLVRQKVWGAGADPYCVLHLIEPGNLAAPTAASGGGGAGGGGGVVPAAAGKVVGTLDRAKRWTADRTRVERSTLNPEFGAAFMWTVRRPREASLQIEVWNRYALPVVDRFMGCAVVRVEDYMGSERAERTWEVDAPLRPKGKDGEQLDVQGTIRIRLKYESSLDLL
ncbi:Calpain-6 [Irineochytrium annulatum]|nr:Calpain-6 [Irineochytrium annulatum]